MNFLNRVQIMGVLARMGEVVETVHGPIARMVVRTEYRPGRDEKNRLIRIHEFHRVWSAVPQHCRLVAEGWAPRGRVVLVEGRLRTWQFLGSDGNPHRVSAVRASHISFFPWTERHFDERLDAESSDGTHQPDEAIAAALGYSDLSVEGTPDKVDVSAPLSVGREIE